MPSERTSTPLPFCAWTTPVPARPRAITRSDEKRKLGFMEVSRVGAEAVHAGNEARSGYAEWMLPARCHRRRLETSCLRVVVVQMVEAGQFFQARERAVHEPVAMAVPQRVGMQGAAEPALFGVQALAAFIRAEAVFDAEPDVLQPAYVIQVEAAHRRVVHTEELVEQAFGIAQHEVERQQLAAFGIS